MEYTRDIDPLIVHQLQQAATHGKSATQLLSLWQSAVEAVGKGGSSRVHIMIYFREAFIWGIGEMATLGAWSHFGESTYTDEMIDNHYAALLEEWRTNPRKREEEERGSFHHAW